ncbi:glycogen debranching enzyme [Kwoniella europaea PYCC6329]|uniref:Glycogen debranching enzyme n=1 Tax=Kwoniella europaea PYCC6329 TaxID=1423913 RepID=A0AAX4KMG5_9TREE
MVSLKPTSIQIPLTNGTSTRKETDGHPKTPKTPQDEAIAFFSGESDGRPVQVWELALEDDGGPGEGKDYIRLPPPTRPYVLRFSIRPGTNVTRNGVLKSDFPMDGGEFKRGDWKERRLPTDLSKPVQIDLPISAPGAFCYYIEYDGPTPSSPRVTGRKGYFNVDPIISLPERTPFFTSESVQNPLKDTGAGVVLPKSTNVSLDGLIILSVLAKWMGKSNEWEKHFEEASRRGYNMLHWAPLQQRGYSGSPYSIKDQLSYDQAILVTKDVKDGGVAEIEKVVKMAKEKYGLGSVTDVVLNHMAYDSPWLEEHPEAGYSPHNTPHLAPAVELEDAILTLSTKLPSLGLPTTLHSEGDLQQLIPAIRNAIDEVRLWEYYVFDVRSSVSEVGSSLLQNNPAPTPFDGNLSGNQSPSQLAEVLKHQSSELIDGYKAYSARYCSRVKPEIAAGFIQKAFPNESPENQVKKWGEVLDVLNVDLYAECNDDVNAAVEGIVGRLRFTRLEDGGPKLGEINQERPLVEKYFTRLPSNSTTSKHPKASLALANNGWMWGADPLKNFAEYPSKAYIRRQVIVWDDCVKLRYGTKREDNPWLWDHMIKYTESLASTFDGFRLDNCHSTPLELGVTVIDAGRRVNPNLYIMAELFTGSQEMDLKFVRELGINSLVREAYNGHDVKNFADLLWRFGLGKPVGSMDAACLSSSDELSPPFGKGPSRPCIVTPLQGSVPHAVFYDLTHDNQSPFDKRTAEDALSTGALVTFSRAALGSNKGFDDLYPKLLDLVTDNRLYEVSDPTKENGIGKVKRVLNHLHTQMMEEGYTEGHVHEEGQYIMIHRVHPITHKGYMLIAHCAFKGFQGRGWIKPIKLSRTNISYLFGASVCTDFSQWKSDPKTHKGIPSKLEEIAQPNIVQGQDHDGLYSEISIPERFDPGSIMAMHLMKNNDLGHPLCAHLREGTWALDYVVNRLQKQIGDLPRLSKPLQWLTERFDLIKSTCPAFMRPKYFALVIYEAYKAARRAVVEQSSEFISSGHSFTHDLALCSVQMYGLVKSASINPAKPVASLAAGLPHFAAGWARCWGRDVFISLRGLFLTTGNFPAARDHILSFGSTLKHGLIPNLLDSTRNPRYNCRDGPWWFCQNIQDYTKMCPNGLALLNDKVKRRFPADDTWVEWDHPRAFEYESSVEDLVQEILQRHAEGIEFREYNAGPNLDMDMRDEGFNQKIWVDWDTGIIFGGNRYNCGTWMDKMGSSDKAGNKGLPATPRDGAPVEITGLLKSTLTWVDGLAKAGKWHSKGVQATIKGEKRLVTYKQWADLIQKSFEKCYYVPADPSEDANYDINPGMVNRRGIYKDVYGTPKDREWSDYQLRCNYTLPMIVAPELFTPEKAIGALQIADAVLRGPLGFKTLDPSDSQYRGDYDNSNDSHDQAVAKGWNYHQGPEWGFPTGWFLMAYLKFDRIAGEGKKDPTRTMHYISNILQKHAHHIDHDPWRGLPELTNSNGAYCYDSCNTQAWSASTILDVLEEMHKIGKQ